MSTEFSEFFKLGRAERLQLVEDLWDSIVQEEADLPLPDWKRQELRRRKERFLKHPLLWAHVGPGQEACSKPE